jgi:hypothetical protein
MLKIYLSNRYVIIDMNGVIKPYSSKDSFFDETPTSFVIVNNNTQGRISIAFADAGTWFDEAGTTAYTETTLRTFLQTNTATVA